MGQSVKQNNNTQNNNQQSTTNFPPPPTTLISDIGCINEEPLIVPSTVPQSENLNSKNLITNTSTGTNTKEEKPNNKSKMSGFKIDSIDDLLADLEETPAPKNRPLNIRTESQARSNLEDQNVFSAPP